MKKQIITSDAKKAAECWNKRLDEALKKKGYSQYKFKTELNERYNTNFTQAMISDWHHVGEGKERIIGFPVYTNMVIIAKFLDVDVGYLTGETDMETFTIEKVSDYTNLSESAINAILRITGSDTSCINWGYESKKYKCVLNKLLISSEFIEFIKALGDMEVAYSEKSKTKQPFELLHSKLGDKLFNEACRYSEYSAEEHENLNLSEDVLNAIILFEKAQDECYSLHQNNEYDIKVCKYCIQERLNLLINQLYPDE